MAISLELLAMMTMIIALNLHVCSVTHVDLNSGHYLHIVREQSKAVPKMCFITVWSTTMRIWKCLK
jgi:hypothetical protein